MKDRVPTKQGRRKNILEGIESVNSLDALLTYLKNGFYSKIERADEPVEAGTAIKKATLIDDEVATVLKLSENDATVNNALRKLADMPMASFIAWVTNANTDSLDAAFGKNNEDLVSGIGRQLAMYAWFKGEDKLVHKFSELVKKSKIADITSSVAAMNEINDSASIKERIRTSPYARVSIVGTGEYVLFDGNTVNVFTGLQAVGTNTNFKITEDGLTHTSGAISGANNITSLVSDGNVKGFLKLYKYLNITCSSSGYLNASQTYIRVGGIGTNLGTNANKETRRVDITSDNLEGLTIAQRQSSTSVSTTVTVYKIWLSNT